MQMTMQLVLVLGAFLSLIVALMVWRQRQGDSQAKSAGLPVALKDARLAYAERLFRSPRFNGGWVISARVDRVYRNSSGLLVQVELKTRAADKVYQSDVIELSAQRFAIEGHPGERVSDAAYVFVKSVRFPNGRFHKVGLMPRELVVDLAVRRERLLAGADLPYGSDNGRLCEGCSFRWECPQEVRWLADD
ncbi:MAG: PD-(D/E)XK nuclease family protein [Burkholderiales bacterium]